MDARAVMENEFKMMLQYDPRAELVTITTGVHSDTVRALFDRTYLTVDPDTQATVQSNSPRVVIARGLISFPVVKRQTTVYARGDMYFVRQTEDDDEGAIVLYLEKE